jgi:hypothetical protein
MTDIKSRINSLLTTDASKETGGIINQFGSKCSSFVEFGTRGGISGALILGSLLSGKNGKQWMPRYIGVDLVADESVETIDKLAKANGISFQFWRGHTTQYPIHETDALLWDTFHSGGALLLDLERLSPYVHKYIMILGINSFGSVSEAVSKNFDIAAVAKELFTDEVGAKMGLNEAISKFLEKHSEWSVIREFGELCVLERKIPISNGLFTPSA